MPDNKSFTEDCLRAHNDYRRKHGVSPLKLNKDISATAQKWANYIADGDKFEHSAPSQRQHGGDQMGENIAMKWSSANDEYTGQQATDQWYSEIERYNFDTASGPRTGHFTQVVWRDSQELGVGRAQTKSGKWLVVCNYHPAGNFIGRYKENVFPPTSGKVELPKQEDMPTNEAGSIRPMSEGDQITSTGTQTSIRKEITTKADGTKVIKTIVTETKIGPDGKKTTTTRETVTEGSDDEERQKKTKGQKVKTALCCGRPRKGAKGEKGKKPQSMKQFIDEVVKFHNKYRKIHGKVGDLKHNKELSVLAQSWAERMAATSALGHSNNIYKGKEVGENVATKWSSQGADYLGAEVVDQWYKESDKYDFSGDFQQGTGHFTQVVWKNSKEIGVGKAYSKDGRVFVVCNYHAAGNVLTTFKDNVFPAKK